MPISLYNSNIIQLPLTYVHLTAPSSNNYLTVPINHDYAIEIYYAHIVPGTDPYFVIQINKKDNSSKRLDARLGSSANIYQKVILLPDEEIQISNGYINVAYFDKPVPAAAVQADLEKTQVPYAPITRPDFMAKDTVPAAAVVAKDTVQTLPVLPTVFDTVPTIRSLREMGYSKKKAKKMLKQIREDHNA